MNERKSSIWYLAARMSNEVVKIAIYAKRKAVYIMQPA